MTNIVLAASLSLCQILSTPSLQPPPCVNYVCTLQGRGGLVQQWEMHVDRNHGSLFVIKGLCASACYLAVQHAMEKGERVTVLPGAVLMHHDPTPLTE